MHVTTAWGIRSWQGVALQKRYTAVRCPQPKGWNRVTFQGGSLKHAMGSSQNDLFLQKTQQSVIATLTEGDNTYSRKALAPDEIDDETVDTFAPFLPDPTPAEKKPYFLDAITIEGDEELQLAIRSQ